MANPFAMQAFIEETIQALRAGTYDRQSLTSSLEQLNEELERVESQYTTAPAEEEELRLSLLQGIRYYQLALDLLARYLQQPGSELLVRALEAAHEASLQMDQVEEACAD